MAKQRIVAVRFVLKAGCYLKYLLLIEGSIHLQLERHCNILIHALIHAFLWKLGLTYIRFFLRASLDYVKHIILKNSWLTLIQTALFLVFQSQHK